VQHGRVVQRRRARRHGAPPDRAGAEHGRLPRRRAHRDLRLQLGVRAWEEDRGAHLLIGILQRHHCNKSPRRVGAERVFIRVYNLGRRAFCDAYGAHRCQQGLVIFERATDEGRQYLKSLDERFDKSWRLQCERHVMPRLWACDWHEKLTLASSA